MDAKKIPLFIYTLVLLHISNGVSLNFDNHKYRRPYKTIHNDRRVDIPVQEDECVCFGTNENQKSIINSINPNGQGVERLVVFLYKPQDSSKIYVHTPNMVNQRLMPVLPLDESDEFHEGDDNISELFSKSQNVIPIVNNDDTQTSEIIPIPSYSEEYAEPIGINTGKIREKMEEIVPIKPNYENLVSFDGNHDNIEPFLLQKNLTSEEPEEEQDLSDFSGTNESVSLTQNSQSADSGEWSKNNEQFSEDEPSTSESSHENLSDEDTSQIQTNSIYDEWSNNGNPSTFLTDTEPGKETKEKQTSNNDDQNLDSSKSDEELFSEVLKPVSNLPNSQDEVTQHSHNTPVEINYIDYEPSPPSHVNKNPEIEEILFGQEAQHPETFYSDENNIGDQDYMGDQLTEISNAPFPTKNLENDETNFNKLPQHQQLGISWNDKSDSSDNFGQPPKKSSITNISNNEPEKQHETQTHSSSSLEDSDETQEFGWEQGKDIENYMNILSKYKNKLNPSPIKDEIHTKITKNSWPWIHYMKPLTIEHPKKYNIATFDKWFNEQIKQVKKDKPTKDGYTTMDVGILKLYITSILQDNGLFIATDGELINHEGQIINIGNLKLRPILIGNPVAYKKLLQEKLSKRIEVPSNLTYLEAVLISLMHPPKVLGIIPIGKTTVPRESSNLYLMDFSRRMKNDFVKHTEDKKRNNYLPGKLFYKQYPIRKNYKSSSKQTTKYNSKRVNTVHPNLRISFRKRKNEKNHRRVFPYDQINKLKEIFRIFNSRRLNQNKGIIAFPKKMQHFDKNKKVGKGSSNVKHGDDYDFRIIGGRAAISSGTPVSTKGRSGFVDIADYDYRH